MCAGLAQALPQPYKGLYWPCGPLPFGKTSTLVPSSQREQCEENSMVELTEQAQVQKQSHRGAQEVGPDQARLGLQVSVTPHSKAQRASEV